MVLIEVAQGVMELELIFSLHESMLFVTMKSLTQIVILLKAMYNTRSIH